MTKGHHGSAPVTLTFMQTMGRITRSVDSIPLLTALGAAATMLTGFIVYQFAVRPDFKALRIKSNATDGIDKPLQYHDNRLKHVGMMKEDPTPKEIKDIIKSIRSS